MPLYEYTCKECGVEFERMVRLSPAPSGEALIQTIVCPSCGSDQTQKLISSFASRLSGQTAGASASASASAASCSSSGSRFR